MWRLKVLLIQPSTKDCVQSLFSIYNSDEGIGFKPPLGLLYVATAIKKFTCHDVKILDCQLDNVHSGNIMEHIDDAYDVIGISAWTDFWYQALSIAKAIKEKYPHSFIVMGGPHVNIFPREVLGFSFIDAIIMGDGEIPMLRLLDFLSSDKNLAKEVPGVYFSGQEYAVFTPYIHENLDSLPIPDRRLLPFQRYTSVLSRNKFVTSMITSRGCPYECIYCKLSFQKPLSRSAENIVEEFKAINNLGIKEIEIYDDTFNWNHQRTKEICKMIIEEGLNLKWSIRDRVDRIKEEVLKELKKAGCWRINLGIETGSQRVMDLTKKRINLTQADSAVALAKKYKFTVLSYFMYGLPTETQKEAYQTLSLALRLDTDYVEFSIAVPYPGTELYKNALKEGIIPVDYWGEFALKPSPSFLIPYVVENLISRQELLKLRNLSIRKFYFRPRFMFRELLKIRSYREFLRKSKMAMGLFQILRGVYKK